MTLSDKQQTLCDDNAVSYDDLKAVTINGSLKREASESHTGLLLSVVEQIFGKVGVGVERIHLAEHCIPPGVQPDMTEHGWETDDWPTLWKTIIDADILLIGTPIWLGEPSSLARLAIERLYGMSGFLNERGQSVFYNKIGGVVVTGNEDGIKHCAMGLLYSLQHLGYTIPPQADCGWIGEAGPGPSYGDERTGDVPVGYDNEFTQRNTTIMSWNLLHLARLLKDAGGIPNHGNDRKAWQAGCRFDYQNPDYRS